MLLPLLGTCALVGPFHGSEWEPVWGLLSQDGSCGDLRCYGNLLVLCLFVIWQVWHCWHHVNKTHPSWRKTIKVPPQERAVSSRRHVPEFCNSLGELRDLDGHVQRWIRKQRWGYQRSLQESWVQCLLSSQRQYQGPPWDAHILGSTSFSSTCLIPRDSYWDAWEVSCGLSDGHTHLIQEPLPLDLEICQRMEQLWVHSLEELAPDSSMRSHPTSVSLSTSLPNLSSAQRLQFCPREFPSVPSDQQQEMPTWRSWGFLQEAWAPEREHQIADRGKERTEDQALRHLEVNFQ
ncbi:PREDICTED: uncharacterized protein C22orf46 homolog [Chrysochloris asiatica]|uniref:Uncharacterized protein C22orf46 homolog n=1 Tax=Chrysochloris asiatica TaxID=185453 RepID=A0A9B0TN84_CHRAS|nr:PREDICTED: uncharacterized protein C22orf46 homolog [Chrysochloris asiatica]